MIARRDFLKMAALGAAIPQAPIVERFANLRSMRGEARPISPNERLGRLEKARRLMTEQKIDALLMIGGTSLVYFSNIRWGVSERLFAMVVPVKGAPFYVCPSFEEDRAREQIARGPLSGSADVRNWHEHESPYQLIAQGLRDRGIASGRVGVEEAVRLAVSDGIAAAAPALKIVSATPVTAGCRSVKDAHEIELMRLASRVTLRAYTAAFHELREGMTQNDFGDLVSAAHEKLGFPGEASVQVGEYSALPNGS